MDMNELFANHQRALYNARQAANEVDKSTYFDLVDYYAKRIKQARDKRDLPSYRWA